MCGKPTCREAARVAAAAKAAAQANNNTIPSASASSIIATPKAVAFRGPGRPPSPRVVSSGKKR